MSKRRAESPGHFLHLVLESLRAGLIRRSAVRAALWASAAMLGALAALLLADAAWGFAPSARFAVYLAALAIGASGVGAAALAAWVRRPSLFYMAHQVERRCPELKNALVTFLELSAEAPADPSFAEAVARRAARVLARRDPASLAPPEPLRRPAAAAACAAAALGLSLWLSQGILFEPWVESAQATVTSAGRPSAPPGSTDHVAAENPAQQEEPRSAAGASDAAAEALSQKIAEQTPTFERLASALQNLEKPTAEGPSSEGAASEPGKEGAATEAQTGPGGEPQPASAANTGRPAPGDASASAGRHDGGTSAQAEQEAGASSGTGQAPENGQTPGEESPGEAVAQAANDAGATTEAEQGSGQCDATGNPGTGGGRTGAPSPSEAAGPPLPPRPQPTELPENPLDATRWADHLVREVDRRLRDGDVTDGFLGEMGMSQADLERFVGAWKRRLEAARGLAATETPAATVRAAEATGELVQATGAAEGRPILDGGPDGGTFDVVQDDPDRVAARFRPVVSAYFAEVERLAGEREERKP